MGLTQDEILKISEYSKLIAEQIQREDEKKYAEMRLKELESQIYTAINSRDGIYIARYMAKKIINMFVSSKNRRICGYTDLEKNSTREYIWKRIREKWSDRNADVQLEIEAQFDQILKVLVENNIIQYNCYSTVCHYRGKK